MKNHHKIFRALLLLLPSLLLASADAPPDDLRFGVMTHFAQGWDPSWIASLGPAGIPTVRDELYWNVVESPKGNFVFPAQYDRYMSGLKQAGVSPLIILSFENPNYDNNNTPYTDEAIAAYANYAVQILRHYGTQIKALEVWNEYNGTFNQGPATQDRAGTYLKMLRATYTAIKRERPDVTVVGGATSGVPLPYWTKLISGGALNYMDAASVHPYRYTSTPEGIENDIAGLQNLMRSQGNGLTRPIWVTEIGWDLKASTAPGDLLIDPDVQARFLVRGYSLLLSAGVPRIYWYLLRDYNGLNMGLLHDDAGHTPKPAYYAMTTLIQQLRGANFVARENTLPDLYCLLFEPSSSSSSGEPVRVVWSLTPRQVMLRGATSIVDLNGKAVDASVPVNLTDSPLFIQGDLSGLPPPPAFVATVLADSQRDFSPTQGGAGWSFGSFLGSSGKFTALTYFSVTDWAESWGSVYPYLSVTAGDQHPSVSGNTPVSAVRRWTSNYDGPVEISGQFQCTTEGDGVGVSVWVNGQQRFRKLLGGGNGNPISNNFDLYETVQTGTTIDFAVDPGPGVNINFDATTVAATIKKAP